MSEIHEGGCICGSVRFRAKGNPVRASVCHCTFCQRRTGSAFATVAFFNADDIEITGGPLTTYEHRSDESHRWIRPEFCARCGTTVTLTLERFPDGRAIPAGTFDDPSWVKMERHIWTRSAIPWMVFPSGVGVHKQSALP